MTTTSRLDEMQVLESLHQGLAYLASVDTDMAREENGMGFSKSDGGIGHRLSRIFPDDWTPWQRYLAWRVAIKYKNTQIRFLPWDRMTAPSKPETRAGAQALLADTPRKVWFEDGRWLAQFGFFKPVKDSIKGAGGKWIPERSKGFEVSVWSLPQSMSGAQCLCDLVTYFGFEVDQQVTDDADRLLMEADRVLASSRAMSAVPIEVPGLWDGAVLRPFQHAGVRFLADNGKVLLADDMGTGKTLQALAAAAVTGAWPMLVICPAVVKLNWAREALTWFPGRPVSVLSGKPGAKSRAQSVRVRGETKTLSSDVAGDVVIINYDILGAWARLLGALEWGVIVCDEAHYLKTGTAARTKAVRLLATGWDTSAKKKAGNGIERRWLLTGTPIMNRPIELVSLLGILDRLRDFGGFKGFTARYCQASHNGFGMDYSGASNLHELNTKLRLGIMIRRTKSEVLTELPGKTRVVLTVELENRREYQKAEADVAAWVGETSAKEGKFLDSLVSLDPEARAKAIAGRIRDRTAIAARAESLVRFSALKQLAAMGKLKAAMTWVEDFLETGRKLVIFAYHKEVVAHFAQALGAPSITGDTSAQEREDAVMRFQTQPECRILVCNIRAGGVGITLTAASDVLFVEQDWNPGVHDQAEDRINRMGQKEPCTAWYLLGQESIDEDIHDLIEQKREVVIAGTDGEEKIGAGIMATLAAGIRKRIGK